MRTNWDWHIMGLGQADLKNGWLMARIHFSLHLICMPCHSAGCKNNTGHRMKWDWATCVTPDPYPMPAHSSPYLQSIRSVPSSLKWSQQAQNTLLPDVTSQDQYPTTEVHVNLRSLLNPWEFVKQHHLWTTLMGAQQENQNWWTLLTLSVQFPDHIMSMFNMFSACNAAPPKTRYFHIFSIFSKCHCSATFFHKSLTFFYFAACTDTVCHSFNT